MSTNSTNSVKITGTCEIADGDYKYICYTGKTKSGAAIKIVLKNAICRSDPSWTFAEKGETTAEVEFEACYDDEKLASGTVEEPWEMTYDGSLAAGTSEIILGVGKFEIGASESSLDCIGLTRGGGVFSLTREIREINADNDPGAVKGRLHMDSSRPKLKLTALTWLTKTNTLYPGMEKEPQA